MNAWVRLELHVTTHDDEVRSQTTCPIASNQERKIEKIERGGERERDREIKGDIERERER